MKFGTFIESCEFMKNEKNNQKKKNMRSNFENRKIKGEKNQ